MDFFQERFAPQPHSQTFREKPTHSSLAQASTAAPSTFALQDSSCTTSVKSSSKMDEQFLGMASDGQAAYWSQPGQCLDIGNSGYPSASVGGYFEENEPCSPLEGSVPSRSTSQSQWSDPRSPSSTYSSPEDLRWGEYTATEIGANSSNDVTAPSAMPGYDSSSTNTAPLPAPAPPLEGYEYIEVEGGQSFWLLKADRQDLPPSIVCNPGYAEPRGIQPPLKMPPTN